MLHGGLMMHDEDSVGILYMPKYQINIGSCHRIPERSFFWKGKQFPVCARCTGYHIGYLSAPLFLFNVISIDLWWSVGLLLPSHIDGITQAFFKRKSNNALRVTTGFMAGLAIMSLL